MCSSETPSFTPVWPHGYIREIFPDIFFVTGTNKIHYDGDDIQTSRNMIIVRDGRDLTLINTVRLNDLGMRALDELGDVRHIVRIGAFHGRDDAFYRHKYPAAVLWGLQGMSYDHNLIADRLMLPGGEMPFLGASLFVFETSRFPEGILHVNKAGGILISCDSIQNITAIDEFYSTQTALSFESQGLVKSANISPIWLRATRAKYTDFKRLMEVTSFKHLLTAHGEPLLNLGKEKIQQTLDRVFPEGI